MSLSSFAVVSGSMLLLGLFVLALRGNDTQRRSANFSDRQLIRTLFRCYWCEARDLVHVMAVGLCDDCTKPTCGNHAARCGCGRMSCLACCDMASGVDGGICKNCRVSVASLYETEPHESSASADGATGGEACRSEPEQMARGRATNSNGIPRDATTAALARASDELVMHRDAARRIAQALGEPSLADDPELLSYRVAGYLECVRVERLLEEDGDVRALCLATMPLRPNQVTSLTAIARSMALDGREGDQPIRDAVAHADGLPCSLFERERARQARKPSPEASLLLRAERAREIGSNSVTYGVSADAVAFLSSMEGADVRNTVYSDPEQPFVITTVRVSRLGVEIHAQCDRPATQAEAAALGGENAAEYNEPFRYVEVPT